MEPIIPLNSLAQSLGLLATHNSDMGLSFVRIVRMSFRPECTEPFVVLFQENKAFIAEHEGCRFVFLLRSGNTFFTVSGWDRPEDLETYRNSGLFRGIWKQTKSWLSEPAQAWSCPIADWAFQDEKLAKKV